MVSILGPGGPALQGGSWSSQEPPNFVNNFQHALAICLNALYANQVTVTAYHQMMQDAVVFQANLQKNHHCKYVCTVEGLLFNAGNVFENVIEGMCHDFDNSKIIVEFKKPKPSFLKDDDFGIPETIQTVPVTDSYQKLRKSGVMASLPSAMNHHFDIQVLTTDNISRAIRKMQRACDHLTNSLVQTKMAAKIAGENIQKFDDMILAANPNHVDSFQPGGFVADAAVVEGIEIWQSSMSGYKDSGKILKQKFPGLEEKVKFPCGCLSLSVATVHDVIIHLNDFPGHGSMNVVTEKYEYGPWTREQIADWTETLDVNLEMKED